MGLSKYTDEEILKAAKDLLARQDFIVFDNVYDPDRYFYKVGIEALLIDLGVIPAESPGKCYNNELVLEWVCD